MVSTTHNVSIKGKMQEIPAVRFDDNVVIAISGRFLRVAEIFDEYWLKCDTLPAPDRVLQKLHQVPKSADVFTFTQRVPDVAPRFNYHLEWDNIAVIPLSSHETWLREQISPASRRNIRTSEKKGVVIRSAEFDEKYVRGIMSIYNESPIRGGRRFWHYGKEYAAVLKENGTYQERSTFLGAYFEDQMIGYMKIVWDVNTAAIMQVLSKLEFREKRPNNALLSEAVRLCAEKRISYLLYERFVYGNKLESSLTRFKRENGFVRMDIPRYYVPLTIKGNVFLKLGLHKDPRDLIPQWLRSRLLDAREKWYARQQGSN